MGINGAGINRFRARVDETLRDVLPCWIRIEDGEPLLVSGPGGRYVTSFLDGGQDPTFRFPFRVPGAAFGEDGPRMGQAITWVREEGDDFAMEITEISVRTAEGMWPIACKYHRA